MCRGIDAPESAMPYGKEAKEALLKLVQGKSLKVYVYDEDRYGRCVGDIYCDGVFVQVISIALRVFFKIAFSLVVMHAIHILFICFKVAFYAQEQMLKKGFAWHYTAYDQRPELAKVRAALV